MRSHALIAALVLPTLVGAQDSLPRRVLLGAVAVAAPTGASGVLVRSVIAGSPAEHGGVRGGDIITRVGATDITGVDQFVATMRAEHPGRVGVVVMRDNSPMTLSVTLLPRPVETAPDFDILYTSVTADAARRRVIVTRPRTPGRHPAVLLVGGIGCFSFDDAGGPPSAYTQVLYHLTRRGFVTVRVEKSGVGDSEGAPCPQVDFDNEAAGYTAALHAMEQYGFVDPARVFLFGHSIGGIEAPMIAEHDSTIRGIIAMSTVGIAWFEYELANLRRQLVLQGVAPDSVDKAMRVKERCMHQLLVERRALTDLLAADSTCRPYVQYPAHYTYMQEVAAQDIASIWREVRARVLVVYPTSDFITSEDEHRYLVNAINAMHPGMATFATVQGMDHYLAAEESMEASIKDARPGFSRPFSSAAFPVIDAWLDGVS
jgi:pimeloyl-ACP methyl ester carboxylesterase